MSAILARSKVVVVRTSVSVALVLAFSVPGFGQSLYGSLVGAVTDPTGLGVPGATVTITQAETNQSREATTIDTGGYTFANLAPGTYQVDVTLPGFQTFRARSVLVSQGPPFASTRG